MNKMFAAILAALSLSGFLGVAHAGQVADLKATLATTRQHTMAMLGESDRTVLEMRYEEALKSSKDLDAALVSALGSEAPRPGLVQFKGVWEAFKSTRDGEIIPALLAGERDKARELAQKVQAPRFKKMNELLEAMPQ